MLAHTLLERVRSLGIVGRATVSNNFHAAVFLAKGPSQRTPIQVIEEARALEPLPLTVLDLTETQAETFVLWSIRTLRMLAALPEKELTARWGRTANVYVNSHVAMKHPRIAKYLEPCTRIQDMPRHLGQHSGGMVICQGQLNRAVPLERASMPGLG